MNWQDKCEVIYHFRNDESILIVTKPEYRFDGCHAVVLDSKTAELALSNNANWKTISGAKVLVGKGGRIIAGMGGKFATVPVKGAIPNSLNGFSGVVEGKDITDSFKCVSDPNKSWAEQISEQQGFNAKPRLVDHEDFVKAATESGVVGFRTWEDYADIDTGRIIKKASDCKAEFHENDKIQYNAAGKQVWGGGIYLATTNNPKQGKMPKSGIREAMKDSLGYGEKGRRATAVVTFDKSAKIADGNKIMREFWKREDYLSKYNGDIGAYLASQGYDGAKFMRSKKVDYVVVYNRTKLVVLNDPDHEQFGLFDEYHNAWGDD